MHPPHVWITELQKASTHQFRIIGGALNQYFLAKKRTNYIFDFTLKETVETSECEHICLLMGHCVLLMFLKLKFSQNYSKPPITNLQRNHPTKISCRTLDFTISVKFVKCAISSVSCVYKLLSSTDKLK